MSSNHGSTSGGTARLTPLNGARFFAVFHIFLYHLYSNRNHPDLKQGSMPDTYGALDSLPRFAQNLLAHGPQSTSFFFLLSGFILTYVYCTPDGTLSIPARRFWWARVTRIYPIHLFVLMLTVAWLVPRFLSDPQAPPVPVLFASALATATLLQAWVPQFLSIWSWPAWALSSLVFLYLIMPALVRALARFSRRQQSALLIAMPLISLAPIFIFLAFYPDGDSAGPNLTFFIRYAPIFWVPHFVAGMLLSRVFGLSRFDTAWRQQTTTWFSFGDLALLAVLAISCMDPSSPSWSLILRHGLLMPLYLLAIYDLSLGRGIAARVFSLPGLNFLGQASFSIFIWQTFLVQISFFAAYKIGEHAALPVAIIGLLVTALVSTYWIELPLARWLRRRLG